MRKCCIKPCFNLSSIHVLNSVYAFIDKILLHFHCDPYFQILIQIITPEFLFHLLTCFYGKKKEQIIWRFFCCAEIFSPIYTSTRLDHRVLTGVLLLPWDSWFNIWGSNLPPGSHALLGCGEISLKHLKKIIVWLN